MYLRKSIKRKYNYFVYIVQCKDGTYYTGYTNNLENRVKLHNKGNGAKYLRGKRPVKLVYCREFKTRESAMHEEMRIKNKRREEKEELIKKYETKY